MLTRRLGLWKRRALPSRPPKGSPAPFTRKAQPAACACSSGCWPRRRPASRSGLAVALWGLRRVVRRVAFFPGGLRARARPGGWGRDGPARRLGARLARLARVLGNTAPSSGGVGCETCRGVVRLLPIYYQAIIYFQDLTVIVVWWLSGRYTSNATVSRSNTVGLYMPYLIHSAIIKE